MEGAKGAYVAWEEVVVSNDKGRRVVHYYLKGAGGGVDLAVVGREKSLRHMSYAVPSQFVRSLMARPHLLPSLPSSSVPHLPSASAFPFKWRSRREVIDWLSSLVQAIFPPPSVGFLRRACFCHFFCVLSCSIFNFLNEARYSNWRPYMCHRQIDNDDVKPFDITQLQGYWSQELLRSMFTSPLKLRLKITRGGSDISGGKDGDISIDGSKKKHLLNDGDVCVAETTTRYKIKSRSLPVSSKTGKNITSTRSDSLTSKELYRQKLQQQLYPGCHVEVLSQDSGIRGCWFQCVIIRRHQDKVKVRYLDIQDPDESGNLQVNFFIFWEKHTNVFSEGDLRQSQDWISNKWNSIRDQMDIANSLLSGVMNDSKDLSNDHGRFLLKTLVAEDRHWKEPYDSISPSDTDQDEITPSGGCTSTDGEGDIPDLTKDPQFKWNSLKKKKRRRELTEDSFSHKKQCREASNSSSQDLEDSDACGGFVLPKSLTVDHENCKIGGDPMFNAPRTLSNLVMSQ
ncbi:hypothetical protein B296_00044356 [Ensete ventricosum]|uniref:Agenet-like domain-containing protein n=1 Tax=Ensete ventricosum TaxID=4639 RepID=A0A426YJC7_ENSVE|nr:hypothetical protein B296_00044356 [Ensete ventricosum]